MKRAPIFNSTPRPARPASNATSANAKSADAIRREKRARPLHLKGRALVKDGNIDDGIPLLLEAVTLAPDTHESRLDLANAYFNAGRLPEAMREFNEIVTRFPNRSDAYSNLAGVLSYTGHQTLAFQAVERALALDPDNKLAMLNLAEILKNLGDWNGARDVYAAAVSVSPDSAKLRMQYGMTEIALGNWPAGWAAMEFRDQVKSVKLHSEEIPSPRWRGDTPIDGRTILISHEQGLGDSIMCVRFARELVARGARVLVRCPGPLVALLKLAPGVSECSAMGTAMPKHDLHVPLMSLPAVLGIARTDLDGAPYLQIDGECPAHIAALLPRDGVPTVSLSWSGNPLHSNDRRRSISGALLEPLLATPGVRFVAMQKMPTMQEVLPEALRDKVVDVGAVCNSFVDSAHALKRVDLVVTVDSSVAHLAGAIGAPTMVCLPFTPDYRWELTERTTPWYTSVELVRQEKQYEWAPVLEQVRLRVVAMAAARAAAAR